MTETPQGWLERLLARLPRRTAPPWLLSGYTQEVMRRLTPPPAWWHSPLVRTSVAAAAAVVVVLGLRRLRPAATVPPVEQVLAQAVTLERLGEPWLEDATGEAGLAEEAQQVDRFVLAQAPSTAARSAESLATLLNLLDEEAVEPALEGGADDAWLDLADPWHV